MKSKSQFNIRLSSDGDCIDEKTSIEKNIPQSQHNQIYFYEDVTTDSSFRLNKTIDEITKNLQVSSIQMDIPFDALNINLYINSCGGEIFGALSTIDRIKLNKIKIHSYVEGIAASAATLLSVVAHTRYIRKNSVMLIHQLSSENWGTYREIKDEVKNLDALMDTIKNIYLNHTKMTETYLNDLLNHDIYLKSQECLELGLVDFII